MEIQVFRNEFSSQTNAYSQTKPPLVKKRNCIVSYFTAVISSKIEVHSSIIMGHFYILFIVIP